MSLVFINPATFADWLKKEKSLRGRLQDIPTLDPQDFALLRLLPLKNSKNLSKTTVPKH
jgi:hypothetical protein